MDESNATHEKNFQNHVFTSKLNNSWKDHENHVFIPNPSSLGFAEVALDFSGPRGPPNTPFYSKTVFSILSL